MFGELHDEGPGTRTDGGGVSYQDWVRLDENAHDMSPYHRNMAAHKLANPAPHYAPNWDQLHAAEALKSHQGYTMCAPAREWSYDQWQVDSARRSDETCASALGAAYQSLVAPQIQGQRMDMLVIDEAFTTTKEQPAMRLYEYAVIYLPRDDEGNTIKADCRILTQPTTMLAESEAAVKYAAIRGVENGLDADFVEVLVVPFG